MIGTLSGGELDIKHAVVHAMGHLAEARDVSSY